MTYKSNNSSQTHKPTKPASPRVASRSSTLVKTLDINGMLVTKTDTSIDRWIAIRATTPLMKYSQQMPIGIIKSFFINFSSHWLLNHSRIVDLVKSWLDQGGKKFFRLIKMNTNLDKETNICYVWGYSSIIISCESWMLATTDVILKR